MPPEVKMVTGTIFLYCIARETNMIEALYMNKSDPRVQCWHSYEGVLYTGQAVTRTGRVLTRIERVINQTVKFKTPRKGQCVSASR